MPPRALKLLIAAIALAIVALVILASSAMLMIDPRPPRGWLALGTFAALAAAALSAWLLVLAFRARRDSESAASVAETLERAESRLAEAERNLDALADPDARARFQAELARIRADREAHTARVVVFGTGSAGKTSLINALLGQQAGAVEPTIGTTQSGQTFDYALDDLDGQLILTDTPGLSEIGEAGVLRESEARDLANSADLLLLVVDHDLTRSEFTPLADLARVGKRPIVVLNKKDRFPDADREAILARLRERLESIVPPEDVVAVAASPRPVPLKTREADGSTRTEMVADPPDLADLRDRIRRVLKAEGDSLRAANLLLRATRIGRDAKAEADRERRRAAERIVEKYQWLTAGTVFANPIPAVDILAAGAANYAMIAEIGVAFGANLNVAEARGIAGQIGGTMLKFGIVEAGTSLLAGAFKGTLVGFAAGGALQASAMAYLTHIAGMATIDYFERGQTWGPGGVQAALIRRFDLQSRTSFLRDFARQAADRLGARIQGQPEPDRSEPSR